MSLGEIACIDKMRARCYTAYSVAHQNIRQQILVKHDKYDVMKYDVLVVVPFLGPSLPRRNNGISGSAVQGSKVSR
jgi:hypothetical protein